MMWHTPDQHYLIRDHLHPLHPLVGPIPHANGIPLQSAAFLLATPMGSVVQRFSAPLDYSLEDDYGICNIYWVAGDTLYDYHWIYTWGNEPRLTQRSVITGLQPCMPTTVARLRGLLVSRGVHLDLP